MSDFRALLCAAFDEFHVTDGSLRAGIAAICMGESDFKPSTEASWAHTDASRIREEFGERVAGFTDAQLDAIKVNDVAFFNLVYGGAWGLKNLGNRAPGDGYKYRGRGGNQLTGLANYVRYGTKLGVDLVNNPDLANDPTVAARLAVVYMLDRYHGGGFEAMKRAVGNPVGSTEAVKDAAYAQYMRTGEFGGVRTTPPAPAATPAPAPKPSTPTAYGGDTSAPAVTDPDKSADELMREWQDGTLRIPTTETS
jgi:predicted chitinase